MVRHHLRRLRRQRKLTQAELGQRVGRLQQEIYRYEKGIVRVPADLLPQLAAALQVSIMAFFPHTGPVPVERPGVSHLESARERRPPAPERQPGSLARRRCRRAGPDLEPLPYG